MNYARIVNHRAVDVRSTSPEGYFTENIVAEFATVPDDVVDGWILSGDAWAAPVAYVPTAGELAAQAAAAAAAVAAAALAAYQATVPQSVTMRQARVALSRAGKLAAVNAAIAAMTGAAGDEARIEWEYSQEVRRDKALVDALGAILLLDSAQLDSLFIAAAAL